MTKKKAIIILLVILGFCLYLPLVSLFTSNTPREPISTAMPGKWAGDTDSDYLQIFLDAEYAVIGRDYPEQPILYLTCDKESHEYNFYVHFKQGIENPRTDNNVRLTILIDYNLWYQEVYTTFYDDNHAAVLIADSAQRLYHGLLNAKELQVQFKPWGAPRVTATFDVRGFEQASLPILQACPALGNPVDDY